MQSKEHKNPCPYFTKKRVFFLDQEMMLFSVSFVGDSQIGTGRSKTMRQADAYKLRNET